MTSIQKQYFYEKYKNITDAGIFKEKSLYLQTNYKCFTSEMKEKIFTNYNKSKNNNTYNERPEKLKIGGRDLSKETLIKKDFMSLLNRLSDQNKKQIINQFKTNIVVDFYKLYIRMTWAMILKFPEFQKLYLQLIGVLHEVMENKNLFIEEWILIISEYDTKKNWIPVDTILDDSDYDEFCDFQKWKKQAISATKCFKLLSNNNWISQKIVTNIAEKILEDCNNYFQKNNGIGCKIVDSILDQLIEICDIIDDKIIVDFINNWLNDNNINLRSSTKFKLLDIKEKVEIKLSATYKVKHR